MRLVVGPHGRVVGLVVDKLHLGACNVVSDVNLLVANSVAALLIVLKTRADAPLVLADARFRVAEPIEVDASVAIAGVLEVEVVAFVPTIHDLSGDWRRVINQEDVGARVDRGQVDVVDGGDAHPDVDR